MVRFTSVGPVSILRSAYGIEIAPAAVSQVEVKDGLAVVEIVGPLTHQPCFGFDNYDGVASRVAAALGSKATRVVLKINSPGGDTYGMLECARGIRALADAAQKPVTAYVNGQATSAAYGLACAADEIVIPSTGCAGSIGVINEFASRARQLTASGLDVAVITSGARKADGHPDAPLTEDAVAAGQEHVDQLAAVFWAWVADRRKMSVEAVAALEASIAIGAKAVTLGLADRMADFRELRDSGSDGTISASAKAAPQARTGKMKFQEIMQMFAASKYSEAMKALAELAEEGDEQAKAAIRKMAAKATEDKCGDQEPDGDEDGPAAAAPAAAAPAAAAPAAAAPAAAAPAAVTFDLAAEVLKLRAEASARAEKEERATLLASRPDVTADKTMSAWLSTAPIEVVREAVKNLPKAKLAPPAQPRPTQGATRAQATMSRQPVDSAQQLRIEMGLEAHPTSSVYKHDGGDLIVFGGSPDQIQTILAESGLERNA